jgi:hypothetical protein
VCDFTYDLVPRPSPSSQSRFYDLKVMQGLILVSPTYHVRMIVESDNDKITMA